MAKIDLKEYLERLEEPEDREAVANRDYQRKLFLEYVVRDSNFPEHRAELLRDFEAGKELTGPKGLRRKLGAIDLEYFGRAYLAHYFVRRSPAFHGELDRIWREGVLKGLDPTVAAKEISRADGCRRAIEAPRGHAKSTTFTFKDSIHAAVYAYKHYEIILSDSSEQVEGFLADIKTEFEENAALREDFGELEGKVWKSSVILTANGVKIEAIGSGKKIRGRRHKQWRPDLIVCDDLENDENVNTPEQRKKLRDWFYKAVSKAGDTYTDIVYIGTLLHFDALLANVAKNPSYKAVKYRGVISFATNSELWDAWESIFTDLANENRQDEARAFYEANREAMLEGTAVLWEEKLSYYDLMVIRISEGEASFNSEIQNDPIDPENCTFQEEWFDFWDDDGKQQPDFSDPRFLFIAPAPTMTNGDVLNAITKLQNFAEEYEFVHIVGESDLALWQAVGEAQVQLFETFHKPMFFVMEAGFPTPSEGGAPGIGAGTDEGDLTDWALEMEVKAKKVRNYNIQVVTAWGRLVKLDGSTKIVNLAGLVSGFYAKSSVQTSIGKTREEAGFNIRKTKLEELLPVALDNDIIELLDLAGYLTFREYDGKDDYFVYHTKMLSPDGSDYRYAEDVRVLNKIIRETRKKGLDLMNDDIDLTDIQGELEARAKFLFEPLQRMIDAKEISAAEIIVMDGHEETFIEDETMRTKIRYLSRGYIREVYIDLARRRPSA